jgi:hypothetical protein
MQSLQDVHAMRELVMAREARLRRIRVHDRAPRHLHWWIGRQLVALGARVAAEPTTQPGFAR